MRARPRRSSFRDQRETVTGATTESMEANANGRRACDPSLAGQLDGTVRGLRMLPIEKRGMADGPDADATALVGDAGAQRSAFVAIGAEEAELHKLVRAKELLELGKKFGRGAGAAELEGGFERLTEAAKMRALGAGEGEFIHERREG